MTQFRNRTRSRISVPGHGVLDAGATADLKDTPDVRALLDAGALERTTENTAPAGTDDADAVTTGATDDDSPTSSGDEPRKTTRSRARRSTSTPDQED